MKYGIQWNYENKAPLENLCDFDLKSWNLPAVKYVLIFIFIFHISGLNSPQSPLPEQH